MDSTPLNEAAAEFLAMRMTIAMQQERMAELERALRRLVDLKGYKDRSCKTPWYEAEQPKAWADARKALEAE